MTQSPRKKLGVIVGVDGDISSVGMYNMSNDANFLWYGDILSGPRVGAFLTINQNDIKIIATVSTEKVIDQQNTIKSKEFDNRYRKNSINRIITLKTRGVIEDSSFQVTSRYVPMIGNEVTLTTKDELNIIYAVDKNEPTIKIGHSLLEYYPIELSINNFFASHIGIFGNTGSGKSNTLHKIYLELFKSDCYYKGITKKSKFFVIDFNGEYTGNEIFGVKEDENKEDYDVNTKKTTDKKLPIKKDYLFNADILSILFDAKPATQVPFLRRALNLFKEKISSPNPNFGNLFVGTLKKILTTGNAANQDSLQDWIQTAKKYYNDSIVYNNLDKLRYTSHESYQIIGTDIYFNRGTIDAIPDCRWDCLKIKIISSELDKIFNDETKTPIRKLQIFLDFQKVYATSWGKVNREHLNPLFNRIDSAFSSLEKVVEVKENIINNYKTLNIISLVHANQEITRLIPMLLSKMIYDEQKDKVAGKGVTQTRHLIIDEAHNILNSEHRDTNDNWQDYRLSVFEEIIKEGRKFGFYLTLASQRPADISPTILSQVHNFFIHRLVNYKDLYMLENTMPTLDKTALKMIPSLGKGEVIITGNAIPTPVFVKVDKEMDNHPKSDDTNLTKLWIQKDETAK
ncbi:ATP-binding protein [Liquorilactobacillus satsumensis]|uniref:ATP-binding protein n=1 Tax=Liquorilactobacillus satsumensis TaxID=259059 RepID=UPI0021C3AD79|nr:ATP-binding protein [Liquorilactobacillus satsumensis]MCP9356725.1 ATP-binding protein [Liquorilactobacillus satsumensis]MCP9370665.1 ATP-binding protein [Liquorilactobacillus satsumensis]